jgi:hypothetical protein
MTVVEWYKNELNMIELTYLNKVIDRIVYMDLKSEAFEKANKMFEKQIMEAFKSGDCNGTFETINAKQYYNETFKTK